ncbi:MAG: hypothetical protein H0T89_21455 [Deltaproteobacteria bacterium]|nr:hypothetical protein [Deltaproteobacteria bacterium]MDQ3297396.1 hypothetical protein [Myxococcota bacterium]
MPRFLLVCVLVLVGSGCFFDADYRGQIRCGTDERCPVDRPHCYDSVCHAQPLDAAVDGEGLDADARPAALNCADPGMFPATGGTASGTTVGQSYKVSASCGGFVMNGTDAIYRIELPAGKQLVVSIDDGARKAYVLGTCPLPTATPICLGNMRATLGNPIAVNPAAGASFIVVDDENATASGPYRLRVTVN